MLVRPSRITEWGTILAWGFKVHPSTQRFRKNLDGPTMFNPTHIVIQSLHQRLRAMYDRTYGALEPGYPGVIGFVAQLALENIATSDAAYHDVNHTILVTLVGQEIFRGRHIHAGGVTPRTGCTSSSHCFAMTSVTCEGFAKAIVLEDT